MFLIRKENQAILTLKLSRKKTLNELKKKFILESWMKKQKKNWIDERMKQEKLSESELRI